MDVTNTSRKHSKLSLAKQKQVESPSPFNELSEPVTPSQQDNPEKKRKVISPITEDVPVPSSEVSHFCPPPDFSTLPEETRPILESVLSEWLGTLNSRIQAMVNQEVESRMSRLRVELEDHIRITSNNAGAVIPVVSRLPASDPDGEVIDVTTSLDSQAKDIEDMAHRNDNLHDRCNILEGRVARADREIDVMKEDLLSQQARSMRDNVQFFNIPDREDEVCREVVEEFMKTEMKIPEEKLAKIKFDRIHRVGDYDRNHTRVIIGKTSSEGKQIIFQHVRNLKRPYGVSEQLPPKLAQRKKKLMPQYKEARHLKKNVKWSVDKLIIDGKVTSVQKDRVQNVNVSTTQRAVTLQSEVHHSQPIERKGASFRGHRVDIRERDDVIPALHAIYSDDRVGRASNNTYAYRLRSGDRCIEHYEDDGEWGAGAKLLDFLRDNDIEDSIVCISRWSSGAYIGRARYDAILQAAKEVLDL